MVILYRPSVVFPLGFWFAASRHGSLIPFAHCLSAAPVLPPTNNPDVLRSYVFTDETNEARCWEVLSPSGPPSNEEEEEEDEVEYWYPTRKRHFEFSIPSSSIASSCSTTIRQTSFGCGKLGYEVWDSSVALCLYLGQESLANGKRILELGSGCGLPSVVCRNELGAGAVLATDFWETEADTFDGDRLVPTKFHGLNLEYNVVRNHGNSNSSNNVEKSVQKLDWHDRDSATEARDSFRPDLVIGSDLVYYPMDVEPLLGVLEFLLVGEKPIRAVLALPLAPAEREALPEFREKLPERFSKTHGVTLREKELIRDDAEGENSKHLIIDIVPK